MCLKTIWIRKTLAHNLKWHRTEHQLSQIDFAKKLGLSYRLIQELEAGNANSTLTTLATIAKALRVSVDSLLKLSMVRLEIETEIFLQNYKKEFSESHIGVAIRNHNGEILWGNKKTKKICGINGLSELQEVLVPEVQGILKCVMAAEKRGQAFSYTIFFPIQNGQDRRFVRCHPTLIYPNKGSTPLMTSVYMAEIEEDCHANYYDYCHGLFRALIP
jgi:transcriptional regulator with XRE-family HTH domain